MDTVLFIAFEFPPMNNGGVFRPYYFAKYLSEFGIKPIVITLDPVSIPVFFKKNITDYSIVNDKERGFEVVNVAINEMPKKNKLAKFFEIRDRDTDTWETAAEKILVGIKEKYSPKALLVTAPPFTIASFGKKMAKKLNLPLILDMRDAWAYWNVAPYRTWLHYLLTKREEEKCFKSSAAIITTSQQTLDDFKYLHPSVSPDKFSLITNGFDGQVVFNNLSLPKKDKYIIGYSGGFYYSPDSRKMMFLKWWQKKAKHWLQYIPRKEDWLFRSPYFIFQALAELKKINPGIFHKIELHFIGHKPAWFDEMLEEFDIKENIKHLGVYSHKDSLDFQQKCDMLLITSSKVIGGKDYSIAGKTFEYISMQKPILSFVCEGAQKDLLKKTGIALMCDPESPMDNANKITELVNGNIRLKPDEQYIKSLTRKNQTSLLAHVIKQVIIS